MFGLVESIAHVLINMIFSLITHRDMLLTRCFLRNLEMEKEMHLCILKKLKYAVCIHQIPSFTCRTLNKDMIIKSGWNLVFLLRGWLANQGLRTPGDRGSIPGQFIPKTLKMVLDTSLLNTQQYKVRIKGKVEQSRERSSALPYNSV